MPFYAKSEDWLLQSSLLLEARPKTTRITTRYTLAAARRRTNKTDDSSSSTPAKPPPRGSLEIKTYDPVSGVALKYRTVKLAEVGRLVQLLGGQLGRRQAGVPVGQVDEEVLPDAPPAGAAGEGGSGVATPVPALGQGDRPGVAGGAGGGGGKGKKKKGKR